MPDVTHEDDSPIPVGVYWNGKESMFFDAQGRTKGAQFFDRWKERRNEFPDTIEAIGGVTPSKVRRRPPAVKPAEEPVSVPQEEWVPLPKPADGKTYLDIAQQRKAFFDAYVEVGFTREEALELCVK